MRRAVSGLPPYREVWAALKEDITDGRLAVGSELPSESELARSFGASKSVIRRALDELAREGLVVKRQGKRSVVAPRSTERQRLLQVVSDYLSDILVIDASLSDLEFDAELLPGLDHPEYVVRQPVVRVRRTQGLAGEPHVCTEAFMPLARWPDVADVLHSNEDVTRLQQRAFARHIHSGTRRIRAASADREVAQRLHLRPGAPVLVLDTQLWDADGGLVELGTAWCSAEKFRLDVRLVPSV